MTHTPAYDPAACRIGVTAGHTVVNVEVWHPNWGSPATDALRRGLFGADGPTDGAAPDAAHARRMLVDALGATQVSDWVGSVSATDRSPGNAVGMAELQERLTRMGQDAVAADGRPAHSILHLDRDATAETAGTAGTVRVVLPVSRGVAPHCDLHVTVALGTDAVGSSGLTMAQIDDRTTAVRDALVDTVSENQAGILAVTETFPEAVTRHFYLDSAAPAVADGAVLNTLRTVTSTWDLGDATIDHGPDPDWGAVRRFRV